MIVNIKIDDNRTLNKNKYFFGNQYECGATMIHLDLPSDWIYDLYLFYRLGKNDYTPLKISKEFKVPINITKNAGEYEAFIVSSSAKSGDVLSAENLFISNKFKFIINPIDLKGGAN